MFLLIPLLLIVFGLVYPAVMILYYKLIKHSKKTILDILEEI